MNQDGPSLPFLSKRIEERQDCCPRCGSSSIEGEFVETGEGEATQTMGCFSCGLSWVDGYTLTSVEVIRE